MPNFLTSERRHLLGRLLEPIAGLAIIAASIALGYWMGYQRCEIDYGHRPSEIDQLCQAFRELPPQTPTSSALQAPNRDGAQLR